MELFITELEAQPAQQPISFPESLAERYRPKHIAEFVGLEKPKKLAAKLAATPYSSAWLFVGASGTGKTSLALTIADMIPAELHHVPSQNCNLETIERYSRTCNYVPIAGKKFHLILVDEAHLMTEAAQTALLSRLDSTNPLPNTIWIFTANDVERLKDPFLSRVRRIDFSSHGTAKESADFLAAIWTQEAPAAAELPNFARIVKDSHNNMRECLMKLETELIFA